MADTVKIPLDFPFGDSRAVCKVEVPYHAVVGEEGEQHRQRIEDFITSTTKTLSTSQISDGKRSSKRAKTEEVDIDHNFDIPRGFNNLKYYTITSHDGSTYQRICVVGTTHLVDLLATIAPWFGLSHRASCLETSDGEYVDKEQTADMVGIRFFHDMIIHC
jgi:hypothetical protein